MPNLNSKALMDPEADADQRNAKQTQNKRSRTIAARMGNAEVDQSRFFQVRLRGHTGRNILQDVQAGNRTVDFNGTEISESPHGR